MMTSNNNEEVSTAFSYRLRQRDDVGGSVVGLEGGKVLLVINEMH